MTAVFVTRGGTRWHTRADCPALAAGQMIRDSAEGPGPLPIHEVDADLAIRTFKRTPCRTCGTDAVLEG